MGVRRFPIATTILALALLSGSSPVLAAGLDPLEGTWSARVGWGSETLRLRVSWLSESGMSTFREELILPIEEVKGVEPGDFSRSWAPLEWKWVRSAGTFVFSGEGAWFFRPGGTFRFEPTPEFAARLASLGSVEVDARALFWFGLKDVHLDLVDALSELGYRELDIDDIVRLSRMGIDGDWIRAMKGLTHLPSAEALQQLYARGIGPEILRSFESAGLQEVSAESLLRLSAQGITAEWVAGMRDAGYGLDEIDELLRLHSHGVSPEEVAGYRATEGFATDTDAIVRLHTQGIEPGYLRALLATRLSDPGIDSVIRLHQQGIHPEYVREVAELGYDDPEEIVRLHTQGVAAATIRELRDLGYDELDVDELVRLSNHGVDPAFVRRLAKAGFVELTVEQLVRARTQGESILGSPRSE